MKERIQKIIAAHGLCSRRKAEEWLVEGRVRVNGAVAVLGDTADAQTDEIVVDGKPLPRQEAPVYLMLHKPRGYVTTLSDERGRKTVTELVDCGCRVYPVGRLDYLSEGLLLLTNDGQLAHSLMHPRGEIAKIYEVTVRGNLVGAEERLSRPIVLDGYTIRKPLVRKLRESGDKTTFEVTIFEGRNRQIRRMCEAAGLTVHRLCRVGEGSLSLGKLPVGTWRHLTQEEVSALRKECAHDGRYSDKHT